MALKQVTKKSGSRHYETPDGEKYPSVTTILGAIGKPALIAWSAKVERELVVEAAANLWMDAPNGDTPKMSRTAYITTLQNRIGKTKAHQRELKKAGDIGSEAHARIEWTIRKQLVSKPEPEPIISEPALWAFMVWEEWAKEHKFKPLLIEQMLYSKSHGYAGTMDLLAEMEIEGQMVRALVDWKTGKAIYNEALLQNAAYVHALIEMGHAESPLTGLIVRLPKVETDDKPEMRVIPWESHEKLFEIFLHTKELWGWLQAQN